MNGLATYRDHPPWSHTRFELPSQVPTMISAEERSYLHWLGAAVWTDAGHIVEIGPWLGGSTYCLASGMIARGQVRHRLHVYDSFEWRPFMADRAPLPLKPGQSFRPHFERNIAEFAHIVEAHRSVLPDEAIGSDAAAVEVRQAKVTTEERFRWNEGPIEILFIDGAKSWNGMRFLLRETCDSLLPDRSLLVCQDYKYWGTYWVAAIMTLLGGAVEPVHILRSNTVAFRLVADTYADRVESLPRWDELDFQEGEDALRSASMRLHGLGDVEGSAILQLSLVRFLCHRGSSERARAQFRSAERSWPLSLPTAQLERARRWVEDTTATPLPASLRLRASRLASRVLRRFA